VYYVCIINLGYGKGRDNDQPGHHQETGTGWLVRGCASGEPQPERGRIQVAGTVESFVRETVSRVILRPMTPEIAALAVRLPANYPKDPADRLIGSTAIVEGFPLVTADECIRAAKIVDTIW
jgi:predicted nucleic acid-binding protein